MRRTVLASAPGLVAPAGSGPRSQPGSDPSARAGPEDPVGGIDSPAVLDQEAVAYLIEENRILRGSDQRADVIFADHRYQTVLRDIMNTALGPGPDPDEWEKRNRAESAWTKADCLCVLRGVGIPNRRRAFLGR